MAQTATRQRQTRSTRPVPPATPPAQQQPVNANEAAEFRQLAQEMLAQVQALKAENDNLKAQLAGQPSAAVPIDPYAGKSAQELLTMALKGDTGAQERLMSSFGTTEQPEPEPVNPFLGRPALDVAFAMAEARAKGDTATYQQAEAVWNQYQNEANGTPAQQPAQDSRYGEFQPSEVRDYLLRHPEIAAALGTTVGNTGRMSDSVIEAGVRGLRFERGQGTAQQFTPAPTVPAQSAPTAAVPADDWLPRRSAQPKTGGRGGNYSAEAEAWYVAEATRRLAPRGLTLAEVVKRMSPQKWADLSLGDSQVRNSNHGEPWDVPTLTDGPLAGQKMMTSNFKGSDTSFSFGFASWLAHVPQWSGKPATEGGWNGNFAELARQARGRDAINGPTEKMFDRAQRIVARCIVAGFNPV